MLDDGVDRWHGLLAEVDHHGAALRSAIEGDDVVGAIAAAMQVRRTRAAVARIEAPTRLRGSAKELAMLDELTFLTLGARAAEGAIERWIVRPLPSEITLLASPVGTAVLADSLLPGIWDFDADLVVLVGTGLETIATLLLDLGQQRLAILGSTAAPPRGALSLTTPEELVAAMKTMVPGAPSRVVVRGAVGSDREVLAELTDRVTATLADLRIHRNTVCAFSRTWIAQATTNLPALARWPSVAAVDDRFVGVPMIIVAPGPSLARNVEQLRGLGGRAIITAFSHSVKAVLAAGVVPDLVLTVDPQDVRYHFSGCDLSQTRLVTAATAHPSLFELPARGHLTLSANCAIDDWIFEGVEEDAVVPGGGSVATTALSLALRWGCNPIVFVGLDLSFPGGAYYVGTSSDGEARAEIDAHGLMRVAGWSTGFRAMKAQGGPSAPAERTIELPGWSGGTVPSSFMFGMFHRWFVEQLRGLDGPTVFNCTEGGAYIEGMDHKPLADVLAGLSRTYDISADLDAATTNTDSVDRAERFTAHFSGYLTGLLRCRRLAKHARSLIAAGLVGVELERTERRLSEALRPLVFVSLVAQREVERASDIARRAGSTQDYLAGSIRLLDALLVVIDELRPQLETALGRLASMRHGHTI